MRTGRHWLVMQELEPCGWATHFWILGVPPLSSVEIIMEAIRRASLEDIAYPDALGPLEPMDFTEAWEADDGWRGAPEITWDSLVCGDVAGLRWQIDAVRRVKS